MKMVFAIALACVFGLVIGSVCASVYLTWQLGRPLASPDIWLHYQTVRGGVWADDPFLTAHLGVAAVTVLCVVFAAVVVIWDRLVTYGQRKFQTLRDLKKADMINEPGDGFLLGEQITPPVQRPDRQLKVKAKDYALRKSLPFRTRKLRYVAALYSTVSNVLMIAPTRSGKGVGFVIPNALTFPGSMVVLDVKGELWDETSRARKQMGDKVFRFAPLDFEHPTHQYNPLAKLADIKDMEELWTGLERVAQMFLQSQGNEDWLEGAILLFIAAGVLAIQRKKPTMGEIYRIIFGTGEGEDVGRSSSDLLAAAAQECGYAPAARELSAKASLDPRIQQSYISILNVSGLAQWANPKVERVTQRSDFDFREFRRTPQSVYLVVHSDDIERLNSLIRLFFADLISFMRSSKPKEDEPFPVFMLLDEFDQLGRMPLLVQAMKQTAGHGGRFAIVTQSVPGLLSIPYTPEEVKAIESACQVKLYIAASEDHTAGELETALGTRTGRTVSRTKDAHDIGFGGGSATRSTEDRPLLSKQEIRDMDPDKIIILPERQDPIFADRIKYYESKEIMKIHAAQKDEDYPLPPKDTSHVAVTIDDARATAESAAKFAEQNLKAANDKMQPPRKPESVEPIRKRGKRPVGNKKSEPTSSDARGAVQALVLKAQKGM